MPRTALFRGWWLTRPALAARSVALGSIIQRVADAGRVLRTILGAPDYERYVAHARERHPGSAPLSRDEFERQRLESRYCRPGGRCC